MTLTDVFSNMFNSYPNSVNVDRNLAEKKLFKYSTKGWVEYVSKKKKRDTWVYQISLTKKGYKKVKKLFQQSE